MTNTACHAITACRVCGGDSLVSVLNLGKSALTGVFPKPDEQVDVAPLELLWCAECSLLQLRHSHDPSAMYGDNYGYRSGLNASMVSHLRAKAARLDALVDLRPGDTVLDIGCNDGTLLAGYTLPGLLKLGIDPTADKFSQFHDTDMKAVADFFTKSVYDLHSSKKAKIITSIAMFYDLEDPVAFARDVASCLAEDGVWHFEQSYMPSMLRAGSYDTVCHEHLEYYSLENIITILERAELVPISVRFNSINGGSFSVSAAHKSSPFQPEHELVTWLRGQEARMNLRSPAPFRAFEERVFRHRDDLSSLITALRASGSRVMGYGASTKGNVMLQFCGLGPEQISCIAEVNPEKYGRFTPGSNIPIVSEEEARDGKPDYFLVMPWHFREGILKREAEFLRGGGRLIFPLPEIEIVGD